MIGARALLFVVAGATVLATVLDACSAHADDEPAYVTLARTCVSEASWGAIESGDCAAIAEIGRRCRARASALRPLSAQPESQGPQTLGRVPQLFDFFE